MRKKEVRKREREEVGQELESMEKFLGTRNFKRGAVL